FIIHSARKQRFSEAFNRCYRRFQLMGNISDELASNPFQSSNSCNVMQNNDESRPLLLNLKHRDQIHFECSLFGKIEVYLISNNFIPFLAFLNHLRQFHWLLGMIEFMTDQLFGVIPENFLSLTVHEYDIAMLVYH